MARKCLIPIEQVSREGELLAYRPLPSLTYTTYTLDMGRQYLDLCAGEIL
jgi:hypothetical protein